MYSSDTACLGCYRTIALLIIFSYVVTAVITTTQNVLQSSSGNAVEAEATSSKTSDVPVSTRNADAVLAMCPSMLNYVFDNATPREEANAGTFEEYTSLDTGMGEDVDALSCLAACCKKARTNDTCNLVFIFKRKCYHVRCVSNEACLPKQRPPSKLRLQMMLVSPVRKRGGGDDNITWMDVIKEMKSGGGGIDLLPSEDSEAAIGSERPSNSLSFWKQPHKFRYLGRNQDTASYDEEDFPIAEKRVKQMLMPITENNDDLSFFGTNLTPDLNKYVTCDLDLSELGTNTRCGPKEECVPVRPNSATGVCQCIAGLVRVRNHQRECVPAEAAAADYPIMEEIVPQRFSMSAVASELLPTVVEQSKYDDAEHITGTTVKAESDKKLVVSAVSKEVRLPEKEVTLAAFTVPDENSSGSKYKYLWTLITQPKGPMNGTISDQSQSKVRLSNLSEGLYIFKVSVTGDNGTYGEAMANVTVLPEKRTNRVPQVMIKPKEQTIRQPITNAILDGSTSTDDDKIVSWHWEVVQGPIGYQPKLPEVNTLQLTDLTSPGNYTFKLTVSDSDNVTNSTTANITVLKGTDYPPVANAGDAVILYLPNNNVTLNGTASTDDHEIVAWEWTKDAGDDTKAVDMQNTRTPYLQLSNLEEGIYTFVLKVTDGSGQFSTAKVHVLVKAQTNTPPVAVAGGNQTINLPRNWVVLNGSASSDDIRIQSYHWKQNSGPNTAVLANSTAVATNATSLTLGVYEFVLSVVDEDNNTATDSVWIKVVQEKNAPPVANAGGDQSVTLPLSALYLNGTSSSDDLAVERYVWTREESSLAAGLVLGASDKQPVMILTNLVHGRYVFKLTVYDEQGLSSSDVVSIIVHPDPLLMNLVQLTLPMGPSVLTQSELNSIVQKIGLLLGDMKIFVRALKCDGRRADSTILVFYVMSTDSDGQSRPVSGLTVEQLLKDKFQRDAGLLGTDFTDIRTTVCQNKCSGHGVCNPTTRACTCEAFWMPSITYYWGIDEANCDWSILYVFVGVIISFLLLSGLFWGITCACRQSKKPPKRPKLQKYSLIGNNDEEAPQFCRTTTLSDSETDSDVLFETRTKPNGILRSSNAAKHNKHNSHGQNKYAITKLGRKVKT
ncbi:dyslexia-associated protein KIAA0319-like protein [Anastrepha ludens]|uniref:dyslexia-associated protein KIAA0319-like protein n=1 Tax=Anastrepha ludens TaxID=28586 RepID=UPI0023AF8113|nr:dyslexia-associated protein KIAA0319-like protein [Anastrepha ludens]XP_053957909.1 dyslexia-associated protein KIAA0319-like protein [Anastrepha ludens]